MGWILSGPVAQTTLRRKRRKRSKRTPELPVVVWRLRLRCRAEALAERLGLEHSDTLKASSRPGALGSIHRSLT